MHVRNTGFIYDYSKFLREHQALITREKTHLPPTALVRAAGSDGVYTKKNESNRPILWIRPKIKYPDATLIHLMAHLAMYDHLMDSTDWMYRAPNPRYYLQEWCAENIAQRVISLLNLPYDRPSREDFMLFTGVKVLDAKLLVPPKEILYKASDDIVKNTEMPDDGWSGFNI